jgi:hypothetical protein
VVILAGSRPTLICISGPVRSLVVRFPTTVARKFAKTITDQNVRRFDMTYFIGPMPHLQLSDCIAIYGAKMIPVMQDILKKD